MVKNIYRINTLDHSSSTSITRVFTIAFTFWLKRTRAPTVPTSYISPAGAYISSYTPRIRLRSSTNFPRSSITSSLSLPTSPVASSEGCGSGFAWTMVCSILSMNPLTPCRQACSFSYQMLRQIICCCNLEFSSRSCWFQTAHRSISNRCSSSSPTLRQNSPQNLAISACNISQRRSSTASTCAGGVDYLISQTYSGSYTCCCHSVWQNWLAVLLACCGMECEGYDCCGRCLCLAWFSMRRSCASVRYCCFDRSHIFSCSLAKACMLLFRSSSFSLQTLASLVAEVQASCASSSSLCNLCWQLKLSFSSYFMAEQSCTLRMQQWRWGSRYTTSLVSKRLAKNWRRLVLS